MPRVQFSYYFVLREWVARIYLIYDHILLAATLSYDWNSLAWKIVFSWYSPNLWNNPWFTLAFIHPHITHNQSACIEFFVYFFSLVALDSLVYIRNMHTCRISKNILNLIRVRGDFAENRFYFSHWCIFGYVCKR